MSLDTNSDVSQSDVVSASIEGRDIAEMRHEFPSGTKAFLALPTDTSDPIVNAYLKGNSPNEYMLYLLRETTSEGDQVIDLGCHVGTFSVGAAALLRNVIAVDASPFHVALVERSRQVNHFDNLSVHWFAIDATRNSVKLLENGIWSHVDRSGDSRAITVRATTLDEFVARHVHGRVAFMKMDIEGAEIDAIRSGCDFLIANRPVILFESNGMTLRLAGSSVEELRSTLESLSYRIFRVEDDKWIHVPEGQVQPEAWVDMLALSPQHQETWNSRITWQWDAEAIFDKCVHWASLPYRNTAEYLLSELRTNSFDPKIESRIAVLADSLEERLREGLS